MFRVNEESPSLSYGRFRINIYAHSAPADSTKFDSKTGSYHGNEEGMTHPPDATLNALGELAEAQQNLANLRERHADALQEVDTAQSLVLNLTTRFKELARSGESNTIHGHGLHVTIRRPVRRYVDITLIHDHPEVLRIQGAVKELNRDVLLQAVDLELLTTELLTPYLREDPKTAAVTIKQARQPMNITFPDA